MIKPTPGRVVWFYERGLTTPHAAIVTFVHSDSLINITMFDYDGNPHPRMSIPLLPENSDKPTGSYAEWMPYQLGQAAKTEQVEKKLHEQQQPQKK